MDDKPAELKRRTKKFALDTLRFIASQPYSEDSRSLRQQLIRSATAVGANYRAACRSRSRAEFIAKIGVTLEEADELCAIFAASSLTAKANAGRA